MSPREKPHVSDDEAVANMGHPATANAEDAKVTATRRAQREDNHGESRGECKGGVGLCFVLNDEVLAVG